jgi:hypothetical protein
VIIISAFISDEAGKLIFDEKGDFSLNHWTGRSLQRKYTSY